MVLRGSCGAELRRTSIASGSDGIRGAVLLGYEPETAATSCHDAWHLAEQRPVTCRYRQVWGLSSGKVKLTVRGLRIPAIQRVRVVSEKHCRILPAPVPTMLYRADLPQHLNPQVPSPLVGATRGQL